MDVSLHARGQTTGMGLRWGLLDVSLHRTWSDGRHGETHPTGPAIARRSVGTTLQRGRWTCRTRDELVVQWRPQVLCVEGAPLLKGAEHQGLIRLIYSSQSGVGRA